MQKDFKAKSFEVNQLLKKQKEALRSKSVLGSPIVETTESTSFLARSMSWMAGQTADDGKATGYGWTGAAFALMVGIGLGYLLSESRHNPYSSLRNSHL